MFVDRNTRLIHDAVLARIKRASTECSKAVLDAGCGDGRLLGLLAHEGYHCLAGAGWDIKVPEGAKAFSEVDFSEPQWSQKLCGNTFDYVIATEVIEHLANPYRFLAEVRGLIRENGQLILTFPNVHNLRSIAAYALVGRFSGFFGPNFNKGHPLFDQHIFIPNIHLIKYFLKITDFRLRSIRYINGWSRAFAQTTMAIVE